ncbi:MAG: Hpt domain-containing protein [Christensenellales bacterium]|jgi:hypothetical protein
MGSLNYGEFINCDEGITRLRGNSPLYKKLLGLFADGLEMERLEKALEQGDLKEAELAAHSLKGIAGNLSMRPLFAESEAFLYDMHIGADCAQSLLRFKDVFEKTREAAGECLKSLP